MYVEAVTLKAWSGYKPGKQIDLMPEGKANLLVDRGIIKIIGPSKGYEAKPQEKVDDANNKPVGDDKPAIKRTRKSKRSKKALGDSYGGHDA